MADPQRAAPAPDAAAGSTSTVPAGPLAPLAAAARLLAIVLGAVMLVSLSGQVFMRYVLGIALAWSEEVALGCFTWCTLLSLALGVRDGLHVRMDLLVDRLPARAGALLARAVLLATAAVGGFIAWAGLHYVQESLGTTSAAIGYPIALLYAAAPVCGVLIALFSLERTLWPAPVAPDGAQADAAAAVDEAQVGRRDVHGAVAGAKAAGARRACR